MHRTAIVALMNRRNTTEDRFALAAMKQQDAHNGRPTASLENGRIVFTYPDGTKTCGGQRIN